MPSALRDDAKTRAQKKDWSFIFLTKTYEAGNGQMTGMGQDESERPTRKVGFGSILTLGESRRRREKLSCHKSARGRPADPHPAPQRKAWPRLPLSTRARRGRFIARARTRPGSAACFPVGSAAPHSAAANYGRARGMPRGHGRARRDPCTPRCGRIC